MSESNFLKRIYIINLDRKPTRWEKIQKSLNKEGLQGKYHRSKAIDGKKLSKKTIQENTTLMCRTLMCNRGMIGGGLSHSLLWKQFINDVEKNYSSPQERNKQWLLVFEDDAELVSNYKEKIIELENEVTLLIKDGHQIELINLNCAGDCHPENRNFYNSSLHNLLPSLPFYTKGKSSKKISENLSETGLAVGFQNYLISYQGAKNLVSFIEDEKLHHHIDVMSNKIVIHSTKKPFVKHIGINDSSIQTLSYPYLPILLIRWSNIPFLQYINWMFSVMAFSLWMTYNINHYIYLYLLIVLILYFFTNTKNKINNISYLRIFFYFMILDLVIYLVAYITN